MILRLCDDVIDMISTFLTLRVMLILRTSSKVVNMKLRHAFRHKKVIIRRFPSWGSHRLILKSRLFCVWDEMIEHGRAQFELGTRDDMFMTWCNRMSQFDCIGGSCTVIYTNKCKSFGVQPPSDWQAFKLDTHGPLVTGIQIMTERNVSEGDMFAVFDLLNANTVMDIRIHASEFVPTKAVLTLSILRKFRNLVRLELMDKKTGCTDTSLSEAESVIAEQNKQQNDKEEKVVLPRLKIAIIRKNFPRSGLGEASQVMPLVYQDHLILPHSLYLCRLCGNEAFLYRRYSVMYEDARFSDYSYSVGDIQLQTKMHLSQHFMSTACLFTERIEFSKREARSVLEMLNMFFGDVCASEERREYWKSRDQELFSKRSCQLKIICKPVEGRLNDGHLGILLFLKERPWLCFEEDVYP